MKVTEMSGDSGRYCFDGSRELFDVFKILGMISVKISRWLSALKSHQMMQTSAVTIDGAV